MKVFGLLCGLAAILFSTAGFSQEMPYSSPSVGQVYEFKNGKGEVSNLKIHSVDNDKKIILGLESEDGEIKIIGGLIYLSLEDEKKGKVGYNQSDLERFWPARVGNVFSWEYTGSGSGRTFTNRITHKVIGFENITTPAGVFDCVVVERKIVGLVNSQFSSDSKTCRLNGLAIRSETTITGGSRVGQKSNGELISLR